MVKVSLREYNREIEGMIEAGQLDEAVAHCQHILKTFPMHVETYRLIGKSFLEARRYTDAADIFQRALMAVPDDFVAHVGMSIIRDDEGKLDDAIWHMERAFEDQPSNPAIQSEIRRLYGRRDGVEPSKIRLSRDALANMYSQGELFNQAIAEIRAVLADDTNRVDLQVMLARAYYRSGQKVEAAEIAANLLKKYTYCMDALRILVDVLPASARVENTQIYRQRLGMLDPYSTFVTGSVFSTDQVAETAVNLERLEYKPGTAPASPQPYWASSLGIKLTDEKRVEPAPDWTTTGDSAEQFPVAASDSSGPSPAPAAGDKPIPDWMRTAGWQESSGKAQERAVDFSAQQPAEPLAKADLPDWIKSMAPQELTEANAGTEPAPANPPSPGEGDAPDWLAGLGIAAMDANPEPFQPAVISQDNNVFPDWLKEMGDSASAGTAAAFTADALLQPQTEETPSSTQPVPPPPATQVPVKPPVSTPSPDVDTSSQPAGEPKPLKIQDDAMAWLESLAAKQGAKEEELLTRPEDRSEEMPDWLRSTDAQPSASAKPEASPEQRETVPLEPLTPLAGELAAHEPAPSEELPTKPENRSEEMPDWLRSVDEQPASLTTPEPSPAPSENVPLEPFSPPAEEIAVHEPAPSEELPPLTSTAERTAQPPIIEDDTKAWLEGLSAEESAKPEELLPNTVERSEPPPEWIQKTTQEPAAPEEVLTPQTPQAKPEEDVSITSWLSELEVEEALGKGQPVPEVQQPAAAPLNELPDWLKELEKPVTPEEAPHLPWRAVPGKPAENLPDWLLQPGQPTDQGAVAVPTPEIRSEPEMPAWIDETIPVSELPEATTPGEWVPMDEESAPSPDLESIAEPASLAVDTPIQRQTLGGTGMLSRVPAEDKNAEFLAAAQAALDARQLNESMQAYARLIKKNRLLDEVIHDLREAIYRFPVDIIVWQTLGDASMRANRLQDALDAYTKAEELLR
ncbi:MAG: tetratricopeptide repeat protein [Chloroflexi bacterium]|nr:tetratricopeptide repeat protein [Chloroflexota bacterium]